MRGVFTGVLLERVGRQGRMWGLQTEWASERILQVEARVVLSSRCSSPAGHRQDERRLLMRTTATRCRGRSARAVRWVRRRPRR